jgi:hypothetical protein
MTSEFVIKSRFVFDIVPHIGCKDYRQAITQMNEIPWFEYYEGDDFNEVVNYILLMYDKGSVLIEKQKNVEERKRMAIMESGISEEMVELNTFMIEMISAFLRYQNDKLWTLICVNEAMFQEYSEIVITKLDRVNNDKDLITAITTKEKVREYMDKTRKDLEAYLEEFYAGDKELEEKHQKLVRFSPESISRQKNIG